MIQCPNSAYRDQDWNLVTDCSDVDTIFPPWAMWSPLAECLKWMSGYIILSYVMSSSAGSLENEYSYVWKCSPSLWFIMDEGVLYGCHNSALSTASSQTAPLSGSSQFIIDHPSSPHLLRSAQNERMRRRRRRNNKGHSWLLFLSVCLSLEDNSTIDLTHSESLHGFSFSVMLSFLIFPVAVHALFFPIILFLSIHFCLFVSQGNKCMVMRWDEIRFFCHFALLTYRCMISYESHVTEILGIFMLWIELKDYMVFYGLRILYKPLVNETIYQNPLYKLQKCMVVNVIHSSWKHVKDTVQSDVILGCNLN